MKKLFLLFVFVVASATISSAQFRAGFSFDYGIPTVKTDADVLDKTALGDYAKGGIGGRLLAKYAVTENIDAGLELGVGAFAGAEETYDDASGIPTTFKAGVTVMTTTMLTGDYYFSTNNVAPYVGLGLGFSRAVTANGSVSVEDIDEEEPEVDAGGNALEGTLFAASPRVGLKVGKLNIDVAYNILTGKASDIVDGGEKLKMNNSHLRIGVGFLFGRRN
ncbi:outer membrane beta-barrel protein [Xanthovirga aplysinae]|uniref:outer membrane beta-barrel protein n=1 Tax=Xanthovirga aplysinae TaxID=2529853 RepID=UPI0012BCDC8A|nr:outer membrane beta-barrel protein [Xanthovirga aplysinae]MTI30045.1 hypothetical protein [Xanthovirga aplysinae]